MTPRNPTDPAESPEILSDEELRSRAAADAQRLYERQLEAYRAQRAQLLEARRVREEYERRRAAYEEACRAYYESKKRSSSPAVVRVDPDTGAQVFVSPQPGAENPPPSPTPSEAPVPAADASVSPAENASPVGSESEVQPEEASETRSGEGEVQPPEIYEEVPAEPLPAKFPLISVLAVIFFAATLSALGYIVFSEDPRFEVPRGRILSLILGEGGDAESPSGLPSESAPPERVPASPRAEPAAFPPEAGEAPSAFGSADAARVPEVAPDETGTDVFSEIFAEE